MSKTQISNCAKIDKTNNYIRINSNYDCNKNCLKINKLYIYCVYIREADLNIPSVTNGQTLNPVLLVRVPSVFFHHLILQSAISYCHDNGFTGIVYKTVFSRRWESAIFSKCTSDYMTARDRVSLYMAVQVFGQYLIALSNLPYRDVSKNEQCL